MVLMPERCAFWPARRMLLVADLHLGKCETFRSFGAALPIGVNGEMLARLAAAAKRTEALSIVILGDLLHAPVGVTECLIDEVASWRAAVGAEILVVPGNHDRSLSRVLGPWKMERMEPGTRDGPFAFHHHPHTIEQTFVWCGHEHPAKTFRRGSESIKLPGFLIGTSVGILPAFTSFAAGGGPCVGGRFFPIVGKEVSMPLEPRLV